MKSAVSTLACYSLRFSEIFINSFRHYYPTYPLVVVDNNFKGDFGKQETAYLKHCRDVKQNIIYVYNKGEERTHGDGLDIALQYLQENDYDLMINVDIDTLHRKPGIVEACEQAWKDGYKYGGSWHIKHVRQPEKRRPWQDYHVHSSFGFYDVKTLTQLGISFLAVRGKYDTAEFISYTLRDKGLKAKALRRGFIHHFAAGTLLRENGKVEHCGIENNKEHKAAYLEKLKTFFERDDVKPFLEKV